MTSGIWMLVVPIAVIFLIGLVILTRFFVSNPSYAVYIVENKDWGLLTGDPQFLQWIVLWALTSVAVMIVSGVATVLYLLNALSKPVRELKKAADSIKAGRLDFEVMTSDFEDLNGLCTAFESMRKRLQEADLVQKKYERERKLLIANISHDLRTPISSIQGYAQGILDGVADTPERRREYLATICQKAAVLAELAESMGEFSAYEMKRVPYEFQVLDLVPVLRGFVEESRLDLESEGIGLTCTIPEGPLMVLLDQAKLRRVLSNVVGNAIKYRKPGPCTLEIDLEAQQGGVCITVTDNGKGIGPEDIRRVFESHFRGDPSRTSQVKGQGLGLSIAKQIVESHKGKLWLKSEENVGTTVFIYLPNAAAPPGREKGDPNEAVDY